MDFAPIRFDASTLKQYEGLFAKCFPVSAKFSVPALEWLYRDNPDGHAIGFDAWEGDQLAAHYACIPARVMLDGQQKNMLLSLNTATNPAFQGKGLFTNLASRTYESAASMGYSAVFGVANANSTPGFVRKLGFSLIEPLDAAVGIGPLNLDQQGLTQHSRFQRTWDASNLPWRCNNPANRVFTSPNQGVSRYFAAAKGMMLPAYCELAVSIPVTERQPVLSPLRLFLGLAPGQSKKTGLYFPVPDRLRPSPLNFIFRNLDSGGAPLLPGEVSFSFLDFDAY